MLINSIKSLEKILVITLVIFFGNHCFGQNDFDDFVFRVMTYNIRFAGDVEKEGINSWNNRKELVAGMIRFHHSDIIGLQEALLPQLNDLTELLPGYSWIGVGRDDGKSNGEFSAILFRNDRFKVIRHSTFWLSDTPEIPSRGWDAALPRIVTWAKFKDKETKKIFFVFNTHYDHIGESARNNSSKLLLKNLRGISKNLPVIVTGDFNTGSTTEAYKIIVDKSDQELNLYDAQSISKTSHYGSNVSFNGFGKAIEPGNKIDFIFVTKHIDVLQHGVIDETVDGRYPSDHMPVIAEVKIR